MAVASRALANGDALRALNLVALRNDAPALALRGVAIAQLGDLGRARDVLRRALRTIGPEPVVARAQIVVADAEIALVSRDLGRRLQSLELARRTLEVHGDRVNAAHAGYLQARHLLLIGRLDEAERLLESLDVDALMLPSLAGYHLVVAGIAMRRIRAAHARLSLELAARAARSTGIPTLCMEVERAIRLLNAPSARLLARNEQQLLGLAEIEQLFASDTLVVDACRKVIHGRGAQISLADQPALFALARLLAGAWPGDVSRESLIAGVYRANEFDESHRARLRVSIGRLRKALGPMVRLNATRRGYELQPRNACQVVVLAPPVDAEHAEHAELLALLADGEAWSSSALALASGVSVRSAQRALEALAASGKVESFGGGRACRWVTPVVPGFPTVLLLPLANPEV